MDALIKAVRKLPVALRKSLTWDRGSELTEHAKFTVATDVKVFFCDPYCPWQRGSNENTNGLLRQYYPKGMANSHPVRFSIRIYQIESSSAWRSKSRTSTAHA